MKAFVILLFASPFIAAGQEEHFVNEYLHGATDDPGVVQRREEQTFLQNDPIKSSWIREAEIRLRASHYNDPIDDYRFRLSPANPWEVKANKSYHNQLSETTSIAYDVALSKALKARYLNLIDSYFLFRKGKILEEELMLKKLRSNQALHVTTQFKTEDLLDMESDISRIEIEKAELSLDALETNHMISQSVKSSITWDDWNMIAPPDMISFIIAHDTSISKNLYQDFASHKIDLEKSMYQVSKSEAFSNIGFLQTNMDVDQGDTFGEHVGFQIGVTLPIFNKDKADLARDRFELIEKKNDAELTKKEINEEVILTLQRMRSLTEMYTLIQQKTDRLEMILESLAEDPEEFTLFKYKSYLLNLSMKALETHESILKTYIAYLDLHGLLVSSPMINYLSPDLPDIH